MYLGTYFFLRKFHSGCYRTKKISIGVTGQAPEMKTKYLAARFFKTADELNNSHCLKMNIKRLAVFKHLVSLVCHNVLYVKKEQQQLGM